MGVRFMDFMILCYLFGHQEIQYLHAVTCLGWDGQIEFLTNLHFLFQPSFSDLKGCPLIVFTLWAV